MHLANIANLGSDLSNLIVATKADVKLDHKDCPY